MKLLFVAVGLIAGNFIWQAFGGNAWGVAIERSFFQAIAIGCVWIVRD